jgi:hypothetical protein
MEVSRTNKVEVFLCKGVVTFSVPDAPGGGRNQECHFGRIKAGKMDATIQLSPVTR